MLPFFVGLLLFHRGCAFLGVMGRNSRHRRGDLRTISLAAIDGLAENFDRLYKIDGTLQAFKDQLPLTLTNPLTVITASKVYSKNIRLTVVIPENEKKKNENDDDDDC
jgi:hypothetical protein